MRDSSGVDPSPIRALFVVPDLRFGGAERHVATLLPRMDPKRIAASLVCIGDEGDLFGEVEAAGLRRRPYISVGSVKFCGHWSHWWRTCGGPDPTW